ncbi:MAG: hypothetical protein PF495_01255 [Spirochaetales bacterium]|jgi:hypothetical protein|nr:hypothetical protein [Spirochaetales bacterium]
MIHKKIIVEKINGIDINKARTPKSSGEYKRVRIGLIATGIACAIVVPVISPKHYD